MAEKEEKKQIQKRVSNKLQESRKQAFPDKSHIKKSKKPKISVEETAKKPELALDKAKSAPQPSLSLKKKIKEEEDFTALAEKLKQAQNENLYLRAEFENFKRRSAEEKRQLALYGGEDLLSALANEVFDDWDRALLSAKNEPSFENLKQGLEMIQKKLSRLFCQLGVEILDPTGELFNPSSHEALSHIVTSKVPEGHVAQTIKKTYKFHDKVIRPAQVILAKKKEDS